MEIRYKKEKDEKEKQNCIVHRDEKKTCVKDIHPCVSQHHVY